MIWFFLWINLRPAEACVLFRPFFPLSPLGTPVRLGLIKLFIDSVSMVL